MAFSATAWVAYPCTAGYTRSFGSEDLCDAYALCFLRTKRGALCVTRDVKVKAQAEALVSEPRTIFQVNESIRRANSVQAALKLLEDSKSSGLVPNEGTYAALMLLCKKHRQGDRALVVYEAMKQAKEPISIRTYNSLLSCCQQANRLEDAMRIKREIEAAGVKPDVVTYTTFMDIVVKASPYRGRNTPPERLKQVLDLFKEMEGHSVAPDIKTYNTLIGAAAQANAPATALEMYQRVVKSGLTPTDFTFELLLKCLGAGGQMAAALQVYNEARASGVKLAVRVYNMLIDICATAPRPNHKKAWEFYREMETTSGLKANAQTYISLISASSKVGDNAGVMKAFELMKERGFTKSLTTPAYNQIIESASRTGALDEAQKIYEEMKASGNKASIETYECLMSACIRNKDFERAEAFKEDFKDLDISSNVTVLNSLMKAYGEAGKWEESIKIFRSMVKKGVTPNDASFASVFDACCTIDGINVSETTKIEVTPGMEAAISLYEEYKERLKNYSTESLERVDLRTLTTPGILVAIFSWLKQVKENPPATDLIVVTSNIKEKSSEKQRLPQRHYFALRVIRSHGLPVRRLNTIATLTLTVPSGAVKAWARSSSDDAAISESGTAEAAAEQADGAVDSSEQAAAVAEVESEAPEDGAVKEQTGVLETVQAETS